MRTTTRTCFFTALAAGSLLALGLSAGTALGLPAQTPDAVPPAAPVPATPIPVPAATVRLTATSAASSYSAGSPIGIAIALTNTSAGNLGLSTIVDGNLVVTSVTRDGQAVATVPTYASFDDGFSSALANSLVSVAAGSSVTMDWTSDFNQSFGGEGLLNTAYTGAEIGTGTYYDLSKPGSYAITFHYLYRGPTGRFPDTVFAGPTNSVTVRFSVT